MTIAQMRNYIAQHPKYKNSMYWKAKVTNMPERQVVAIYNKFKQIDYREEQKKLDASRGEEKYHQIDMFEYMAQNGGITN